MSPLSNCQLPCIIFTWREVLYFSVQVFTTSPPLILSLPFLFCFLFNHPLWTPPILPSTQLRFTYATPLTFTNANYILPLFLLYCFILHPYFLLHLSLSLCSLYPCNPCKFFVILLVSTICRSLLPAFPVSSSFFLPNSCSSIDLTLFDIHQWKFGEREREKNRM